MKPLVEKFKEDAQWAHEQGQQLTQRCERLVATVKDQTAKIEARAAQIRSEHAHLDAEHARFEQRWQKGEVQAIAEAAAASTTAKIMSVAGCGPV